MFAPGCAELVFATAPRPAMLPAGAAFAPGRSRAPLFLTAAALLLAGCSHLPDRAGKGWVAHDTRNTRVYSATKIEHRYAQEWLETAFHAYKHSFFKTVTTRPVEAMFLEAEPGGLTRFYRPNDDPPDAWSIEGMPGGGRIGKNGLIVLTERRNYRGVSEQVAYQMISQAMPNAPVWFRIGFARYLSEYRVHYRGDKYLVCYGSWRRLVPQSHFVSPTPYWTGGRAQTTTSYPGRDVLLPIADVLNADWYDYADDGRRWFDFTAYALVSYLIHGRDAWHASRFNVLLDAFSAGHSTVDALATAYPHLLFDELDEEVTRYARKPSGAYWEQNPDGLCFKIPSAKHAEKVAAKNPVSQADVQAALDDLKRMPLWRGYGSWYPTDVLLARSGRLERTPVPSDATKPPPHEAPNEVKEAADPR